MQVQIEHVFASVGDPGELHIDQSSDINIQPIMLLYTTQPQTRITVSELNFLQISTKKMANNLTDALKFCKTCVF